MKKLINMFKINLNQLPDDIGTAISNRIISYTMLSIIVLVSALYSKQLPLILGAIFIICLLYLTLFHTFYLINKNKILYVNGICLEVCEKRIMKRSSLCYIIFTSGGLYYKCTASPKLLKKVKVGMNVSVYAHENAVWKDNQELIRITNPLFFFSSYTTT